MGKNSTSSKRVRLPTPAQLIRPDLERKTRTNLPINHCAEMLTRTLRSGPGLVAQPLLFMVRTTFSLPIIISP
ncbi:hypothetical protein SSUR61_1883 [Streptococcus suis R61]|uniref:Uncharacterized protein n=1 Tax=Streptococcus suis R61 TaxID=996306 RepID=A0AA87F7V9_STRSU|nr:hypothetical protein SSUR61_1883 [Streptococcus suis R61]